MFTDMVGYTALTQKSEVLALELLEEHRRLLHALFPKYGGKEVRSIGDGFLVEFASALEAARCALFIQESLAERNAQTPAERKIQLRIGVHLGDVEHREGDLLGDGVNIASRIQQLAEPGGICITEDVYRQVQNKIDASTTKLDPEQLKGVVADVQIYRLGPSTPAMLRVSASVPAHVKSIAVLPFANISTDPENEYFSDGMTEELINALTKIDRLHVVARTSAFAFKGKNEDVRRIGSRLGVSTVLEGSVRRAGNRLRITAQLISVADGYHLWSERYDRELQDVFAIQDEISAAIVEALKIELLSQARAAPAKHSTENMEAYQLYLQGRFFWNKRTEGGFKKSIECFQQAIAKDPSYALAHAGLADSYVLLASAAFEILPANDAMPKAKAAAMKALAIDAELSEACTALAQCKRLYDWSWAEAGSGFRRAIELNPRYPTARLWYALHLASMGRFDEALAEMKQAQDLDPLSLVISADVAWILYFARRYDEAIGQLRKTLEMDSRFYWAHYIRGWIHQHQRSFKDAIAEFKKAVTHSGHSTKMLAALAQVYAVAGRGDEAQKLLGELTESTKRNYVSAFHIALIHSGLGDKDRAFEFLGKAHEERVPYLVYLKVAPELDSLRSDPRFAALQQKMGLS